LATYAFPLEIIPGIRNIILERGGLDIILKLASTGKIRVHNEIDRSQVQILAHIATGAAGKVFKGRFFRWSHHWVCRIISRD
jgi:hypothetical protein